MQALGSHYFTLTLHCWSVVCPWVSWNCTFLKGTETVGNARFHPSASQALYSPHVTIPTLLTGSRGNLIFVVHLNVTFSSTFFALGLLLQAGMKAKQNSSTLKVPNVKHPIRVLHGYCLACWVTPVLFCNLNSICKSFFSSASKFTD